MPSHHSTLAPRQAVETTRDASPGRPVRVFAKSLATRPRLKPKRDALTRVRHDLRSLVHSVVGYSDLLNEPHYGSLTPEQARFVGHVRSAAEQLQELVDTCIELSRPANDQFGLEPPEVPLGQVVRRLRNSLITRGIVCDLSLCGSVESKLLTLDIALLERAVVGLAQVVAREGAVTLAIRVERRETSVVLRFSSCDALELEATPVALEQLEEQVGNRDFVRLKLAEVLLSRMNADLTISAALDSAVIILTA